MQPRPAGKPGGFVNVTTNYSLGAVSVTTNNANLCGFGLEFGLGIWDLELLLKNDFQIQTQDCCSNSNLD